ncbi:MAG: hypothetical protein U0795_21040 [Pirellulales bacterium]
MHRPLGHFSLGRFGQRFATCTMTLVLTTLPNMAVGQTALNNTSDTAAPADTAVPADTAAPADTTAAPASAATEPMLTPEAPAAETSADKGTTSRSADPEWLSSLDLSAVDRSAPKAGQCVAVRQVQPGTSTMAAVRADWGDPTREETQDGQTVWYYQLQGYRQVDVILQDNLVKSLVVHLAQPVSVEDFASQVEYQPEALVEVVDELGNQLGVGVPELGLLCGFHDPGRREITELVIEPVSGELFRMRAEQSHFENYQRDLADLDRALELNPNDADAHWLKAELLTLAAQFPQALKHADKAVQFQPQNSFYLLTQARLMFETGKPSEARQQIREVTKRTTELAVVRALAEQQLGDLYAIGTTADYAQAISHHTKAIELAAPLLNEQRFAQRRLAKRVLINSHLAVALDVALGNFQKREDAVPKWLQQATDLAEDYIANDHGDPTMKLHVYRTTLQAFATIGNAMDPATAAESAITDGREMMAASQDPIYQARLEIVLAETLFHAARIERSRGETNQCKNYVNNALALIGPHQNAELSSHDKYLMGQIMFLTGSLAAVAEGDHAEAVKWFDKAAPLLQDRTAETPAMDVVTYGELFVSMGVSFWETNAKERAIELTQFGVEALQRDVQAGRAAATTLTIPYSNLAAMHAQQGNAAEAKRFSELVARMQPAKKTQR